MEDDWLSLNTDVERTILRQHTAYGRYITLTWGGTLWKSRWKISYFFKIRSKFSSFSAIDRCNTYISFHAVLGNLPYNEIARGDTVGRYFGYDSVFLSGGIEVTPPCGIRENVKSILVSDGDTHLPSRILSQQHHDRSRLLLHRSDLACVRDVRDCWVRVSLSTHCPSSICKYLF